MATEQKAPLYCLWCDSPVPEGAGDDFCSEQCREAARLDDKEYTAGLADREARKQDAKAGVEVCDSCLDVACDNGFKGYREQAEMMRLLGAEIEDHLCDEIEEPDIWRCGCACHPVTRARLRRYEKSA